ncbi:L-rhamnose/proton symporter RhaT [Photobacterium sp. DNB23_23_1]|uniref:L-rhamnose/proton symporter RhaT n=2 Tax=Photobacterium pectinilyticum TaxID=2906793 RepID=A0ABT1N0N7_9GAMM|nr:L-rhamnose/proton symporter RhaT [Photobacterium sp. ZSDE20]MDD1822645.1 L-rhamnose/proton symporter RhaT [Photobacterium sp. ZSDE20]
MEGSVNLGIIYHFLGALAAASFYIPIAKIKNWRWEISWFINGIASWIVMPTLVTFLIIPDTLSFLLDVKFNDMFKTYIFGALWGVGGLTFGMTLRYLGLSVGYGVAIGITLVVGTLTPVLLNGTIMEIISTTTGLFAILGVIIAVMGIGVTSLAGYKKEQSTKKTNSEFNLKKGIIIAIVCGVMSSFMAFAIEAGAPIQELAIEYGIDPLYQVMPSYIFIMLGGFTTNTLYCLFQANKNNSVSEILNDKTDRNKNIVLAFTGGIIWYMQFFFYGWGHVELVNSELGFVSWTFHMSMLVLCGGIFGFVLKEWIEVPKKTKLTQVSGMMILVLSTLIIGIGAS